jgi:hypothetical protein
LDVKSIISVVGPAGFKITDPEALGKIAESVSVKVVSPRLAGADKVVCAPFRGLTLKENAPYFL